MSIIASHESILNPYCCINGWARREWHDHCKTRADTRTVEVSTKWKTGDLLLQPRPLVHGPSLGLEALPALRVELVQCALGPHHLRRQGKTHSTNEPVEGRLFPRPFLTIKHLLQDDRDDCGVRCGVPRMWTRMMRPSASRSTRTNITRAQTTAGSNITYCHTHQSLPAPLVWLHNEPRLFLCFCRADLCGCTLPSPRRWH